MRNNLRSWVVVGSAAAALGACGLAPPAARADTITFSRTTGTWGNPSGPGAGTATYPAAAGGSEIRWGTPLRGDVSGFAFAGVAGPVTIAPGVAFDIGTLTHFNNPIAGGTEITRVDLTIGLAFSDPAGLNGSFAFATNIFETPNRFGDERDDDIISFPATFASETFVVRDVEYTLELVGFRKGDSNVGEFRSPEGESNSGVLVGRITAAGPLPPATTPLPAAAWGGLALFGVLGVEGLLARRRARGAAAR